MYILGFESSCDETAVAVVRVTDRGQIEIASNRVVSQVPVHRLYGGVVPEIASRAHIEAISPLTELALSDARLAPEDIDLVAVSSNPGLIGALLVGVNFAKAFAYGRGIPLVSVNHMKAHIAACYTVPEPPTPAFLGLAVSGGHTSLYLARSYTDYEEIGATRDDAIGEAFDKVGRLLGLTYPAGVEFDKLAAEGYERLGCGDVIGYAEYRRAHKPDYRLPSPALTDGSLDFSFSGLKTAAVNMMHHLSQKGGEVDRAAFAAEYTYIAAEAVCRHCEAALSETHTDTLAVAGGVGANSHLRALLRQMCSRRGARLVLPPLSLCGDNGVMTAVQGYYEYMAGNRADASLNGSACDLL